ncbi:hypothetical protein UlMin_040769 [Ulmus minor]
MGNYVSCTLATPMMKNSKAARVVFPGGEVKQFREVIKAAEIMLECPNFFLANSKSLHIGRRFSALAADEELEFGNVYILFPMKRVNAIVTAADMAVFFMAANSAAKRISGGKIGILPETSGCVGNAKDVMEVVDYQEIENGDHDQGMGLSLDGVEGFDQIVPEFKYRLAACRSRKPMLETIREEPIRLR